MDYNAPSGSTDANAGYLGATGATQGSKIPPKAAEYPQREIVAAIAASGQTPSNGNLTQLLQAIGVGLFLGQLAGTANALTGTVPGSSKVVNSIAQAGPSVIPALQPWTRLRCIAAQTNTSTTVSFSLIGVGSYTGTVTGPLLRRDGSLPAAGDVPVNQVFTVQPDGLGNFRFEGAVASDNTANLMVITTAVTKKVHGTGADFTDLAAAFAWVSQYRITDTGSVTFQIPAGQFVYNGASLVIRHPNSSRITIQGAALNSSFPSGAQITPTGVNSSTDKNNFFAMARAAWQTELRFTNNQNTSATVFRPSITLVGDFVVQNILFSSDGTGTAADLMLVTGGGASFQACAFMGAANRGFCVTYGGVTFNNVFAAANVGDGIAASTGGTIYSVASTVSVSNGVMGIDVATSSSFVAQAGSNYAAGNASRGFWASGGGQMILSSTPSTAYLNGADGFGAYEGGNIVVLAGNSNNNGGAGYFASANGRIHVTGSSASGNSGGPLSPAANTAGNGNGYIVQ